MTPTHRSHDMTDKLREALNAVQQAAADLQKEIDRLAEIEATIRVNALRGGATTDEAEAMVRGERSFVDFLAKLCDDRAALAAAPQPVPDREACRTKQAEPDRGSDETPYDRGYVWGYRHGLRDGKAEVAPQPAAVDRQALVDLLDPHLCWNDAGTCADVLLARGLRLPGWETMAWAVVRKGASLDIHTLFDERPDPKTWRLPKDAEVVRVAIRVVEGGDDE